MTRVPLHWRVRSALARPRLANAGLALLSGRAVPLEFAEWATFLGARFEDYRRAATGARSLDGWTRGFASLARGEEVRGERALARGHLETAADAFARAPVYWHFAHFAARTEPGTKQPYVLRGASAYRRGLALHDPPIERVQVPYGRVDLPAYLHLPTAAPSEPVPLVVIPNPLNHAKEVMHKTARRIVHREAAVLTLDMPGHGEMWDRQGFRGDESALGPAIARWARARGDVDADRLGAFAVSLGASVAAQMAAAEPAFRAVALFSPAYDGTRYWRWLAPVLKQEIRYTGGPHPVDDEVAVVRAASLAGRARDATAAAFVVDGTKDWIVPPGEGRRFARAWGGPVELREVQGANHGGLERIHALAEEGADWLTERLQAAPRIATERVRTR